MGFEWDERKRRANKAKHVLDFADAHVVFEGPMVVEEDEGDYDEQRFIGLGSLRGRIVLIVFAYRGGNYRIISMRKAKRHEQKIYKDRLG